ncbi:putative MAM and LDL-receptor class A domain-containing protein 1 [Hypsibius exemplaris]|uniref:MAM and LDL-receptor class A domain-containing protein 1 n=1 Tax=Hypsibius exemplaris TaxID=2072580 RepID=A0A1W0WC88_HYPEX|nr:putative MAM and LDL-receptor class A domain-containing protein 1 [Hypsibius exemplaris]
MATTSSGPSGTSSCTFDNGNFCEWQPWALISSDICKWQLTENSPTEPLQSSGTPGAKVVPTAAAVNAKNFYLLFKGSSCRSLPPNHQAAIISPVMEGFEKAMQCFKFRYYMTGTGGDLTVMLLRAEFDPDNEDAQGHIEFHRSGNHGRQWHFASITIDNNSREAYHLLIWAKRGAADNSEIFMDDLVHWDGPCINTDYNQCDFESGPCGFHSANLGVEGFGWKREPASEHGGYDHTFLAGLGHILLADGRGRQPATARITSPVYNLTAGTSGSTRNHCFTFWYRAEQNHTNGRLSVIVDYNDGMPATDSWSVEDGFGDAWDYAAVPIRFLSQFSVTFEVKNGINSFYMIDDVEALEAPCPTVLDCYFEESLCGWTTKLENEVVWARISPASAVAGFIPSVDHSTNSPIGHYVVVESEDVSKPQVAEFISPRFMRDGLPKCFTYWRFVKSTSGYNPILEYHVLSNGPGERLDFNEVYASQQLTDEQEWIENKMSFFAARDVRLSIRVTVQGKLGETVIALDDFSLSEGNCSEGPPDTTPVSAAVTDPIAPTTSQNCPGFWCANSSLCYAQYKICNGHRDCPDGTDEDSTSCAAVASSPLGAGDIAGIVVGVLMFLTITVLGAVLWRRRLIQKGGDSSNNTYMNFKEVDDINGIDNQVYRLSQLNTTMRPPGTGSFPDRSDA